MARLWTALKDVYLSQQAQTQRRKTPRMATLAMEVLAESREEAKDLVYYDALKRVTVSDKVGSFLFVCVSTIYCNLKSKFSRRCLLYAGRLF